MVLAPPGTPDGTVVTVWTDGAGDLTSPPLQASQVAGQADPDWVVKARAWNRQSW
jgi:hypothetical protein